mmetsp:Transcript_1030/g.2011  ORF Transcript_1030/g.2011 Transcript_1030/m.2011 type:complete len:349 (-) Transcript_1030:281-1327(-)|eukprot:CAMPEP_0113630182 /NCGR_PEP_ID=MMETSP0017_2-20120614/15678_1 /TAXON_ID=2856 /ORGANISM="Cylindrotheca closterium" /LENGTH=348 /DNA_ID=CAMNT_0000540629 /DNA_START=41 /DNA_END=1087 /DNA_ORIENTATION=- /assembly_acc=CAM_ASM_000147
MFQALYSKITGTAEETTEETTTQEEEEEDMAKKTTPAKKKAPATKNDDDDSKKRKSEATTTTETKATENRPKRARRTTLEAENSIYEPSDFTMKESEGIKIIKGRGDKLETFPVVKQSIEASKRTVDEILFAHQFLFGKKGKLSKKEMKEHLLEFSGFLKPIPAGKKRTDKEIEKEEEQLETKMSRRAYALNKSQIVDLCNFFALTLKPTKDEPKMDKDTCIDRLLDFLGTPHQDWLVDSLKEAAKPAKPASKKASPAAATSKAAAAKKKAPPAKNSTLSDYQKIKKAIGKKKVPSEEVLRAWVRAYVACFNLDKATTKHAIITCSEKFGVDMSKQKQLIKQILAEEL